MNQPECPKPLQFKPLSPGLGFHPFSDGMPYSGPPAGTTPPPSPLHRRPPARQAPAGTVPASAPGLTAVPASIPTVAVPVAALRDARARAEPGRSDLPPVSVTPLSGTLGRFYLLRRALAFGVDLALGTSLGAAVFSWILANQETPPEPTTAPEAFLFAGAVLAALNWALVTAQELAFGTSVGKRLVGLSLQGSIPAIFLRAFFFVPSVAFGGFGLLWAVFDSRRRCWHDIAVDLQPTEPSRP